MCVSLYVLPVYVCVCARMHACVCVSVKSGYLKSVRESKLKKKWKARQ